MPNLQEQPNSSGWSAKGWDWQVPDAVSESKDRWNSQNQFQDQPLTPATPANNQSLYTNHYSEQNIQSSNDYNSMTPQQQVRYGFSNIRLLANDTEWLMCRRWPVSDII